MVAPRQQSKGVRIGRMSEDSTIRSFCIILLLSALRPPPYHFDEMLAVPWSRFQAMKERYEALKKKLAEDKAQNCQIQRDLR